MKDKPDTSAPVAGLTLPKLLPPPEDSRMTRQECNNIFAALNRLDELRQTPESSLIVPGGLGVKTNRADEIAGLTHFLAENLIKYGPELLSCLRVVRDEYEPLMSLFTRVTRRVQNNLESLPK